MISHNQKASLMDSHDITLTSGSYWSGIWDRTVPGSIAVWEADPAVRQQSQLIGSLIDRVRIPGRRVKLLEIGAANSLWLPHLASRYGAEVYGVDYSAIGCIQAQHQLDRQGVTGYIFCQDMFTMTEIFQGQFDIIISFGLIEHFLDPSAPLASMGAMLRPGGILYAIVPNLMGAYGPIVHTFTPDVYYGHQLIVPPAMATFAKKAGLHAVTVGYIGGAIYGSVINFQTARSSVMHTAMSLLSRIVRASDIVIGRALEVAALNRPNRWLSPYVYLVGQKAL